MFIGSKKIGYLSIQWGGIWTPRDIEISAGLWPRRNPPEGEIAWRLYFTLAWNWLPDRVYERIALPPCYPGSSAAWTGREVRLVQIRWRDWRPIFWRGYIAA